MNPNEEYGYVVRQSRIHRARHITSKLLENREIREQIEAILEANRQSIEKDGVGIDFIGLEGSVRCAFALGKKHKGKLADKLLITPALRALLWLKSIKKNLPVPNNSLELWNKEGIEPEIGNLVVGEDSKGDLKVYLVDTSLVHTANKSPRERVRSWILQRWNRFFLKEQFNLEI